MIDADFESILVPESNMKQYPVEFYLNKYQKHVSCSCGYKLVYVDADVSKTFKSYWGKDVLYNFIISMVKESKYCNGVMKKKLKTCNDWRKW